jgi:peptide deformylase
MIITDEVLLRLPCVDVLPEEVGALREALESELKHSAELGREGIGLAAPQIGIYKNMAIVRIPTRNGRMISIDLVNCRTAAGYDPAYFEREGCLSFPNKYVRTRRFQEIYVVENLVEPHSFIATGVPAVCIQHELDHTKGILLPDVAQSK